MSTNRVVTAVILAPISQAAELRNRQPQNQPVYRPA